MNQQTLDNWIRGGERREAADNDIRLRDIVTDEEDVLRGMTSYGELSDIGIRIGHVNVNGFKKKRFRS